VEAKISEHRLTTHEFSYLLYLLLLEKSASVVLSFPTIEMASLLLRLSASPNEYFPQLLRRTRPRLQLLHGTHSRLFQFPWRNTMGFLSTKDSSRPPEPSNTLAYVRIANSSLSTKHTLTLQAAVLRFLMLYYKLNYQITRTMCRLF